VLGSHCGVGGGLSAAGAIPLLITTTFPNLMDMQTDGYAYESFLRGQNKVPKGFLDDVLILAYSAPPPQLGRS